MRIGFACIKIRMNVPHQLTTHNVKIRSNNKRYIKYAQYQSRRTKTTLSVCPSFSLELQADSPAGLYALLNARRSSAPNNKPIIQKKHICTHATCIPQRHTDTHTKAMHPSINRDKTPHNFTMHCVV